MHDDPSATLFSRRSTSGVLVVDGYGIKISVDHGQLVLSDGAGSKRRERRLWRADPGVNRVVLLGDHGYITLDAIRWLNEVRVPLVQISADGEVRASTHVRRLNDASLRRQQALAATTDTGVEISRLLLDLKVRGQAQVVGRTPEGQQARPAILSALRQIHEAESLADLRVAESTAAASYWSSWSSLEVPFAKRDLQEIPEYWLTFGQRSSPITSAPRLAANPANALLNYLYALLEGEVTVACIAMGLDPGMGFVHTDQGARDSLSLDVMEAVRPSVDRCVLDLLEAEIFRRSDFHENRRGICRVLPPLTHSLAEASSLWTAEIGHVVEAVATTLLSGSRDANRKVITPLTGGNRRVARGANRYAPAPVNAPASLVPRRCVECGIEVSRRRKLCPECEIERVRSHPFGKTGPSGAAHNSEASIRRGNAVSERWAELKEWTDRNGAPPDSADFRKEIWPLIQHLSITKLVNATGLSPRYCQVIRRGSQVPHPRHWENFRRAGS